MANSLSALNPTIWKPMVQDFLNNMLVAMDICNTRFEEVMSYGQTVEFPYINDVRVQTYTPGTDLTIDDETATSSQLTIDQRKAATVRIDLTEQKQARADYAAKLAYQSAYQLKNNIDQTVLQTGVSNVYSGNIIAGGTLSTSTLFANATLAYTALERQNAVDGTLFMVAEPGVRSLLSQTFVANGFNLADNTLRREFGGEAAGFRWYFSNNLPTTQSFTLTVQPSDGETVTLFGVTFTFKTSLGSTAGNVLIGANLAAAQANLVAAINGAAGAGSTYVEISVENRRTFQNKQVAIATFSANVGVVTGKGKVGGTDTCANGSWGTETTQMLFGRQGAPSMALQMMPELRITQEPRQVAMNYITFDLYGTKVFFRDTFRLGTITHNAI